MGCSEDTAAAATLVLATWAAGSVENADAERKVRAALEIVGLAALIGDQQIGLIQTLSSEVAERGRSESDQTSADGKDSSL